MSKASKYREEAEALRSAAAAARDTITRQTILKLAEEYDRMAAHPVTNLPKNLAVICANQGLL
jgi:hypothetical protein